MKTNKFFLIPLVCAVALSCNKNEEPDAPQLKDVQFEVEPGAADMQNGADIFIFDGQTAGKGTLSVSGSAVSLSAKVSEGASSFIAYYPWSASVSAADLNTVNDVFPEIQTAVAGKYPVEGNRCVGTGNGGQIRMHQVCAFLKFMVEEDGYTDCTIVGNGSEALAGPVSIVCASSTPSVSSTGKSTSVTLKAASGFVPGEWYYVAIVPQSLKSGVTCTLSAAGKESRTLVVDEMVAAGVGRDAELGTFRAPRILSDYYVVKLSSLNWEESNVFYVKDASGKDIVMVAKEYFGFTLKSQGVVAYPITGGVADYTKGVVSQITKINNTDPSEEDVLIHGGTLSMTDMKPENVVYTPGNQERPDAFYIKCSDSSISISEPDDCNPVETTVSPLVLVTDVKSHPVAKVGTQIWLASDLMTKKYRDGSPIKQAVNGEDIWEAGTPVMVIYNNGTSDYYMYNGFALGYNTAEEGLECTFSDRLSPEGWRLPSATEYVDGLCGFFGNDLPTMKNLSLLRAANCYKVTKSSGKAKVGSLGYTSSWTSTPAATPKAYLGGLKGDGTLVNAPQDIFNAFSVRLIKE